MRLPRCRCERWLAALLTLTLLAARGGSTAPAPSPTAGAPTPTAPLPTPAAFSAADIAATAASTGCQITPYSFNVDMPELDGPTLAPSPDWGGRWYAGTMAVFLSSATEGTVTLSGARLDGPGAPLSLTQAVDVGVFGAAGGDVLRRAGRGAA